LQLWDNYLLGSSVAAVDRIARAGDFDLFYNYYTTPGTLENDVIVLSKQHVTEQHPLGNQGHMFIACKATGELSATLEATCARRLHVVAVGAVHDNKINRIKLVEVDV
jgi:hypothetical protein